MHLCYSTIFYTLCDYLNKGKNKTNLTSAIWAAAMNWEEIINEDENASRYHSGKDIPNKTKSAVQGETIKNIAKRINTKLFPILKSNKSDEIIKLINTLVTYDTIIDDEKTLCENPFYTKKEFLKKGTWEFEEYLAIILKYVITNDNESKSEISKSRIEFAKTKMHGLPTITIIPYGTSLELPLNIETSKDRFQSTFKEVLHESSLKLPRDNQLKIFMLDIVNNKFEYTNIKNLYTSYLTDYVLSKNEKIKYNEQDKLQYKFFKAVKKLERNPDYKESILGNLLLYSFLEQVLNAPKLFNSVTLSTSSAKSEAVHMLNVDGIRTRLIFGTSEILNDINKAITNAFNKIKTIESKINEERNILTDFQLLNSEFDTETAKLIRDIVVPIKSASIPSENAFSIFIGYSLTGIDKSLSDEDYLLNINNKIKLDIEFASTLIRNLINELDLHGYSFYIYFVPFNNAEIDKLAIVEEYDV